ncbi:DUF7691 family protein [Streptomyces sp. NPDC002156]
MAEQYVSAFVVEEEHFRAMVGSRDEDLVRTAVAAVRPLRKAGKLLRATDAREVERALREIVSGLPTPSRAGGYGWLLELLAPALGEPVGEVVLPGRGWHDLEKALCSWGLASLAELWGRAWSFPLTDNPRQPDPWPFPVLAPLKELDRIRDELTAFDTDRVYDDYGFLPGGDDVEEVVPLLDESFPAWVDAAIVHGRDLLLIRDGGR